MRPDTGSSTAVEFTLDTIPPAVSITTSGGLTNKASQTISGTVTASEAPVGATVSLYDNGGTTPIGSATVVSGGAWSATVTLSGDGTHSITAQDTDTAGNTGSRRRGVHPRHDPADGCNLDLWRADQQGTSDDLRQGHGERGASRCHRVSLRQRQHNTDRDCNSCIGRGLEHCRHALRRWHAQYRGPEFTTGKGRERVDWGV